MVVQLAGPAVGAVRLGLVVKSAFDVAEKALELTKSARDSSKALQVQAETLGITAERLQELHYVGQNATLSVEEMNKALIRFVSSGRDLADLGAFANAVKDAASQKEKLKLVTDAFGQENARLVSV